jgi:sigma-B regulation protein RsbU (phosphoserine phosphatase)
MRDEGIDAVLADLPLFLGVPAGQLAAILRRCRVRILGVGETLLRPGQPNQDLYLLLEGQLRVHLDAAGSPTSFAVDAGQCVGELSLVDGEPVSAFVVSATSSRVLVVPGEVFWSDLMAVPAVARNLMRMVVGRLRDRAEMIVRSQRQQLRFEALQKELDAAQAIQISMLPSVPVVCRGYPGLDLHALMDPAREVGGDFYDAVSVDGERVLIAVGDVSGKGMPAALFMVRSITLLRMATLRADPADDLLGRVNALLCDNNPSELFTTAFAAVVDTSNGKMTCYNGGHPPPLLSRAGGPFEPLSLPRCLVVGILDGAPYPAHELDLAPGDRLVAFSDGVTEAEDPAGRLFGDERLREVLDACGRRDAEGMVAAVRDAVRRFVGDAPQSDDITLLALSYHEGVLR